MQAFVCEEWITFWATYYCHPILATLMRILEINVKQTDPFILLDLFGITTFGSQIIVPNLTCAVGVLLYEFLE